MSRPTYQELEPLTRFLRHAKDYPHDHEIVVLENKWWPDSRTLAFVLDALTSWSRHETGNEVERFGER